MDDKLQKVKKVFQVVYDGAPSSKEVTEVFRNIIQKVKELKDDFDKKTANISGELSFETKRLYSKLEEQKNNLETKIEKIKPELAGDIVSIRQDLDSEVKALYDTIDEIELMKQEPGKKGDPGLPGKAPKHEWNGTKIRFQNPDGSWGKWVDLKGKDGQGKGGFTFFGPPSSSGLEKVLGANFLREGVTEIYFGSNLTLTRTGNGVRVDAQGGSGGSNILTEQLVGTQAGSNVTLDLTQLSQDYIDVQFVARNGQILSTSNWSKVGDTITVLNANASNIFTVQVTY